MEGGSREQARKEMPVLRQVAVAVIWQGAGVWVVVEAGVGCRLVVWARPCSPTRMAGAQGTQQEDREDVDEAGGRLEPSPSLRPQSGRARKRMKMKRKTKLELKMKMKTKVSGLPVIFGAKT